jgi:hypothetical protein
MWNIERPPSVELDQIAVALRSDRPDHAFAANGGRNVLKSATMDSYRITRSHGIRKVLCGGVVGCDAEQLEIIEPFVAIGLRVSTRPEEQMKDSGHNIKNPARTC